MPQKLSFPEPRTVRRLHPLTRKYRAKFGDQIDTAVISEFLYILDETYELTPDGKPKKKLKKAKKKKVKSRG